METRLLKRGYDREYLEDFLTEFYTSKEKFIKIDSHCYAAPNTCQWTVKQALINYCLDKYCTVCIRNNEVYLYNNDYKDDFDKEVKSARRGRPSSKKIEEAPVKTYYIPVEKKTVIPEITIENKIEIKPNSVILSNLSKLWKIGTELDNISIKDLGGKYYQIIEDTLKKFNNKIELQNFTDYANIACDNKDLLYVIQYISNNI